MNWLFFTILGAVVAMGIHRLSREARAHMGEPGRSPFFTPKPSAEGKILPAQEMMPCTVCQAYVIKNAVHCGRSDCPYPLPKEA